MRPGYDEEWYNKAVSTENGWKQLHQKTLEGRKILVHSHAYGQPCTPECVSNLERGT